MSGISEVRNSAGEVVGHGLSEESSDPDVDYVVTIVWKEESPHQ